MTDTLEQKVRDFHTATEIPLDAPFDRALLQLRKDLLAEEVRELMAEFDSALADLEAGRDIPAATRLNMLKEMADVIYVTMGAAASFGFPITKAMERVHESNLSKFDENGKPIRREDGKILKGPRYHPPQMDDLDIKIK